MKPGYLFIVWLVVVACSGKKDAQEFRRVPASESGIYFRNTLTETVDFNIFNYLYFYNGGGVAAGDVNGDGLIDLFFTSNQESDRLYLNQGDFSFKDVTEQSNAGGVNGWATGVTMADVNSDGLLDIYVSYLGDYLMYKGKNSLLINKGNNAEGIPTFADEAIQYGLDIVGFCTQASFFDYDRDGDLDMFMLNHSVHKNGTYGPSKLRYRPHALAGDKLMKNEGGRFVEVTSEAGIYNSVLGYGLGLVVSDVNLDGWPDIYVGNDFHENDYLYINQQDGSFTEVLEKQMQHTSRYTMGVDFGDINNDLFPDLIAMDMLPKEQHILKASAAEEAYDVYKFKINFGYNHQFARNTLQLNNRNGTFSDIGLLAGVHATDWSWSALFADFNLDGWKDLFVANGITRRSNDLDYINFISNDSIQMKMSSSVGEGEMQYISKMPQIKIPNHLFINNGDSTFEDATSHLGIDVPSYSQGATYADLDNDGDLDLAINNIEDEAFIFENQIRKKSQSKEDIFPHFLKISFNGNHGNRFGVGSKVFVYAGGQKQMFECMPTRGYQSSVDPTVLVGVGKVLIVDSVIVVWPDGKFEKRVKVAVDQQLTFQQKQATEFFDYNSLHVKPSIMTEVDRMQIGLDYRHEENIDFIEFNREALIPHMMSAEGPACAVADVNGDDLEDIFFGAAKRKKAQLFIQAKDHTFARAIVPELYADSIYEDIDAEFADVDLDGDADLIVVSGGNEFSRKSQYRLPRLYLNNGKGSFTRSAGLPDVYITGSCVSVSDFDADGDPDIFLGARTTPWQYGVKPPSFLLRNNGKGVFEDVSSESGRSFSDLGFVKDAAWADIDNDNDQDLVVAAEWSPVLFLINNNGVFSRLSSEVNGLNDTNGWWNAVEPIDFDKDGDIDFAVGNLGLNSKLRASIKEPVKMYVKDFDHNDSIDQVITQFVSGVEYPVNTRDEMTKQMPYLKKRYLSYKKFSEADLDDMFSGKELDGAVTYQAHMFETSLIENLGGNKFALHPLGKAAQFSQVNALQSGDFNDDGHPDLLLAGNFYPINIQMGRYDASYGLLLAGTGSTKFKAITADESGIAIPGEIRRIKTINVDGEALIILVRNNDTIRILKSIK